MSFGEYNPDFHGIQDTLKSSQNIKSNFYFLIFLAICKVSLFSHYSFFLYMVFGCVCKWVCRYTRMCGTMSFLLFSSILHLFFWEGISCWPWRSLFGLDLMVTELLGSAYLLLLVVCPRHDICQYTWLLSICWGHELR